MESFTKYSHDLFRRHDDWLREPFDHGELFFGATAIGHVNDHSLQLIFAVKFHEDLHGLMDTSVTDPKSNPIVSHILGALNRADFALLILYRSVQLGACQDSRINALSHIPQTGKARR